MWYGNDSQVIGCNVSVPPLIIGEMSVVQNFMVLFFFLMEPPFHFLALREHPDAFFPVYVSNPNPFRPV